MNKKHIEQKINAYSREALKHKEALLDIIQSSNYIYEKESLLEILDKPHWTTLDSEWMLLHCRMSAKLYLDDHPGLAAQDVVKAICKFDNQLKPHLYFLASYHGSHGGKDRYEQYLDSEKRYFEGDIIITDPCYIMRAEYHGSVPLYEDDWSACEYGDKMEVLGIKHYLTRGTLYGDWSCTTFNSDTKEPIGEFCADAGLVSVFSLDEVLQYNPDFDYHVERPWTTTWIRDFKGEVQIVVKCRRQKGRKISEYHEDDFTDYECQVVGKGINMKTGEPLNFVGKQTGI